MNENLNLVEILKDAPKGTTLYSSVLGDVVLKNILTGANYPIVVTTIDSSTESFTEDGRLLKGYNGECVLFPSKEQRDWSKFTAPWHKNDRFDQKMVKPKFKVGDRVRHKETNKDDVYEISKVYDDSYGIVGFTWMIYMEYQDQYELVPNKFDPKALKSFDKVIVRYLKNHEWVCDSFSHIVNCTCKCIGGCYTYCIPYNDDTKHLVGTTEEAPEFYRYWED